LLFQEDLMKKISVYVFLRSLYEVFLTSVPVNVHFLLHKMQYFILHTLTVRSEEGSGL